MIKLDHIKLEVKDWRAARDWYLNALSLKVEFEVPEGGPTKLGVVITTEASL